MIIYFDSKTGNVDKFIQKIKMRTGWNCCKIEMNKTYSETGHLVTFTTKKGAVPDSTYNFMLTNHKLILSVTSSGNTNWGKNFGLAADKLASEFSKPILMKFELSGLESDVNTFINKIFQYAD